MKQTEVTIELYDTKNIIDEKLKTAGFKYSSFFTMQDQYYCLPQNFCKNNFEKLIANSFIVRTVEEDNVIENFIIYKNKTFLPNGDVLDEEKIKTKVDDAKALLKIFKNAKFEAYATLTSTNYVYNKDNDFILLQDVKELGLFLEVEEFEYMNKLSSEEKLNELKKFVDSLNLNHSSDYSIKKLQMLISK